MQEISSYKDFVPVIAALIGGIIGGILAITGGIIAGRFNRANLKLQLEHQKQEEIRKHRLDKLEEIIASIFEQKEQIYFFVLRIIQSMDPENTKIDLEETNTLTKELFRNLVKIRTLTAIYAKPLIHHSDNIYNLITKLHGKAVKLRNTKKENQLVVNELREMPEECCQIFSQELVEFIRVQNLADSEISSQIAVKSVK